MKSAPVQAGKQVRLAKPQRYGQTSHTPNLLSCHEIIDFQTAPDFLLHSAVHARRQGVYENGVFKLLRSQNGDATDYGLHSGEEPAVLRVTLGAY